MLLLHGAALTALRKELIDSLGVCAGTPLRIGYASGARDARWGVHADPAATDTELLGIGPALHMLEGVVRCTPDRMELDIEHGKFHGEFTWHASFEADAHVQLFGQSTEPVCGRLGYASGPLQRADGLLHMTARRRPRRRGRAPAAASPAGRRVARRRAELRYFQPDPVTDHILALQDPGVAALRDRPRPAHRRSGRHLARLQAGGLAAQARGAQPGDGAAAGRDRRRQAVRARAAQRAGAPRSRS